MYLDGSDTIVFDKSSVDSSDSPENIHVCDNYHSILQDEKGLNILYLHLATSRFTKFNHSY